MKNAAPYPLAWVPGSDQRPVVAAIASSSVLVVVMALCALGGLVEVTYALSSVLIGGLTFVGLVSPLVLRKVARPCLGAIDQVVVTTDLWWALQASAIDRMSAMWTRPATRHWSLGGALAFLAVGLDPRFLPLAGSPEGVILGLQALAAGAATVTAASRLFPMLELVRRFGALHMRPAVVVCGHPAVGDIAFAVSFLALWTGCAVALGAAAVLSLPRGHAYWTAALFAALGVAVTLAAWLVPLMAGRRLIRREKKVLLAAASDGLDRMLSSPGRRDDEAVAPRIETLKLIAGAPELPGRSVLAAVPVLIGLALQALPVLVGKS